MNATHPMTSTTFEIPGYQTVKSFGVVRGIIVRSRSIIGNIGAGIQSIFGGNITLYTELCERTRGDAFDLMLAHAGQLGANVALNSSNFGQVISVRQMRSITTNIRIRF